MLAFDRYFCTTTIITIITTTTITPTTITTTTNSRAASNKATTTIAMSDDEYVELLAVEDGVDADVLQAFQQLSTRESKTTLSGTGTESEDEGEDAFFCFRVQCETK